jgi:hypothetical protein
MPGAFFVRTDLPFKGRVGVGWGSMAPDPACPPSKEEGRRGGRVVYASASAAVEEVFLPPQAFSLAWASRRVFSVVSQPMQLSVIETP